MTTTSSTGAPAQPTELLADKPRSAPRFRVDLIVMGISVIALLILVVFPIGSLLVSSVLDDGRLTLRFFIEVVTEPLFLKPLYNSLILGVATAMFSVAIGIPLAWAVTRTNVPGKKFIFATATLSYLSPAFLMAIAYVSLFSPNAGIVNRFLIDTLGAPWLTVNIFTMSGLIFVTVLGTFPYVYLLAVSALQSVDASYEEAAQILGAGKFKTALVITGPLVAPAIFSGALLSFVHSIALFGSQAILGLPGRVVTLPTRLYSLFDFPAQYGLASALSLVFVGITVAALYAQRRFLAKRSYVTVGGKGGRPQLIDLGNWRWVLFGFCAVVFFFSIALPYLTLLAVSVSRSWGLDFWNNLTFANYKFVLFDYNITRRAIYNSLLLATAAATLTAFLGAILAWIDLRSKVTWRKILDYFALVPLGLPGIVMAVAIIQFWLAMPIALYGTLTILLLAYIGRYIPLGVRAANTSLRQIDHSLEESARILGASWGTTMREITLPLMRPGIFAGWVLVFVPVIQELSASVLLFSSQSITLAVAIYNLYETGYTEPVAALSLVSMVIIGLAIWIANMIGGGNIFARGKQKDTDAMGAA